MLPCVAGVTEKLSPAFGAPLIVTDWPPSVIAVPAVNACGPLVVTAPVAGFVWLTV
jgi:L-serine deaminase